MDEHRRERMKVWTPLFFSLILVAGMVVGFNLRDSLRNKRDLSDVLERNDRLEEIIDLIHEKYVDTINTNLLYKDAISGILKSLDPHTVYIPAEELQTVNDDLEGNFTGIGVEFSIIRDTIEVTSLIQGGPAEKVGVEIGDQIIKVNDSLVAGNGITGDRIIHLLRGKKQSKVMVALKRLNQPALKTIQITRDVVTVNSIDASLLLDSITGYIKINKFSNNTYNDFGKALKQLQTQGMKQLIIDLRDNPGGYLNEAKSIADELLDDGKLVVYTKGLHSPTVEYKTNQRGLFEQGKLALLIDEGSASASEILAGAIQDWDRGVILGRRSFGKGLVQEQYQLTDGSAIRLTIAKYYTPSGRCVQRSFANGKDAYMADYEKRFESGELTGKGDTTHADTMKYYTANHRLVYGGGGITPDVYVPYDTSKVSTALVDMLVSKELKNTICDYYIQNKRSLAFANPAEMGRSFNAQDQITTTYLAALSDTARAKAMKELEKPEMAKYFKMQVTAQLARYLFHDNGYYTITVKQDEVIAKALEVLDGGNYSKIISGK